MRVEYRHLEVLVAIDDTGSITAAAKLLKTNQPHISRQLRRIESILGTSVFERTVNGARPTRSGMEILSQARRALSAAEGFATRRMRILHSRIVAASLICELESEFPDLQPELGVADPVEAYRQINEGHADVYLGVRLPHVVWPQTGRLSLQQIVDDPLRLVLPSFHPQAHRREVELASLARENWLCSGLPDAREMTVAECRAAGGFEPRIRYQVPDAEHMRVLLLDGLGVCFASSSWRPSPGLRLMPYAGNGVARWVMAWSPDRVSPQFSSKLIELVRARFTTPDAHPSGSPAYT